MRFLRLALAAVVALVLVGCGGTPATAATAQNVVDQFKTAGITVENVKPADLPANAPVPRSFKENVAFTVPSLGDKGGQVFVCDTKQNCDAIFAYYGALKALAGPYLYQSPGGTVVVQLNSGMKPDEAAKFEQVVKAIP